MYLKTIKMQGFKSFAKQTVINFDKQITGIVGPNGSGKSNIVDAIRWVLGEQSIKSLRGDYGMVDVIFSGSKNIKGSNIASVTLIFDNSEKTIPVDFSEISMQRKLYYDGSNEYYLNNQACRLMDITNFLLENGLVKDSFNIISQGKIDEIIEAKPMERRVIFEEAAGVLKYKKKKEETIRKLDRNNENMARIDDIIFEVEKQRKPLLREKKKSEKFTQFSKELAQHEIALLASEIESLLNEDEGLKKQAQQLQEQIQGLKSNNFLNEDELQNKKDKMEKITKELVVLQQNLLQQTTLVEKLNSDKKILLERKNYQVEDQKKHQNIVNLKENKGELENYLANLKDQVLQLEKEIEQNQVKLNERNEQLTNYDQKKNQLQIDLSKFLREEQILKSKIEQNQESLDNNTYMPGAVAKVLQQSHLKTEATVGQVLEIADKYNTAIAVVLGNLANHVIVKDEEEAKSAINYLKANNLGRVTFQPLKTLKEKKIDYNIIEKVKEYTGFIDMANQLVKCEEKYQVIINNMLGNVLVVDHIENANKIAALTYYRYKIVTLEGELINYGGSITGGIHRLASAITIKKDLENNIVKLNNNEKKIKDLESSLNEIDDQIQNQEKEKWQLQQKVMQLETKTTNINYEKEQMHAKLNEVNNDITKLEDANYFNEEEDKIMTQFYEAKKQRQQLENKISSLEKEKNELEALVIEKEADLKRKNQSHFEKNELLKEVEIKINRLDVETENKLNYLSNNYKITYEYAKNHYSLEDEIEKVKERVNELKTKIEKLGAINPNAEADFAQIDERYNFLAKQKEDLQNSANNLITIIKELDEVMKKEFMATFRKIETNFGKVFQQLFNGGEAYINLTDTEDILNAGIIIKAQPPGKKLTSIKLLSGGEKSLTAISLLFAILKTKRVAFCVFDEIEASLDEANVETFGEYISKLKTQTQFIVITHKKKTMEYADLLYGITMQEAGISKLVSVRLSEIN